MQWIGFRQYQEQLRFSNSFVMEKRNSILPAVVLFILSVTGLHAQQAVVSASNNATGEGGTVTYTVGQVAFLTKTGTSGIITEGVQQPCEILFMQGIEEPGISIESSVSPNPASTCIRLTIENLDVRRFSCQLSDLKGSVLQHIRINGKETIIQVGQLVPATYILTISENDYPVTVYKIIKK